EFYNFAIRLTFALVAADDFGEVSGLRLQRCLNAFRSSPVGMSESVSSDTLFGVFVFASRVAFVSLAVSRGGCADAVPTRIPAIKLLAIKVCRVTIRLGRGFRFVLALDDGIRAVKPVPENFQIVAVAAGVDHPHHLPRAAFTVVAPG